MKKSNIRFIVLLVFICQLAVFINPAYATSNPIPGVDIIVRKKPGHITTRGNTGDKGTVLVNLPEGDYDLLLLNVKRDSVKVNLTLNVAGQEPRTLSFTAKGDDIKKEMPFKMPGNGSITVDIFDRWGQQITEKPKETKDKPTPSDTKPIASIEHNAGVTRGGTIAKPNSSNTQGNSAKSAGMQEVSTTRGMAIGGSTNNIDTTPGAAISTSRSNIKRPSITEKQNEGSDTKKPSNAALQEVSTTRSMATGGSTNNIDTTPSASISTTQSNIKHLAAGGSTNNIDTTPNATISTTQSNIKHLATGGSTNNTDTKPGSLNREVDATGRPSSIADRKGSSQPANEVESRDRSDVTPGSYSLNRDVDAKGRPSSIADTKPANAAGPPNIVQYSEFTENNTDSKPGQSNKKDGEEADSKNSNNPTPQKTAGTPIQGTPVGLDHDPGGIIAHTTTDSKNSQAFHVPGETSSTIVPTDKNTNPTGGAGPQKGLHTPTTDVPPTDQRNQVATDTKPCTTCSTDTRPWDDKRAEKGAFGIGAGINLIPFQTDISFSGMVSKRVELGTTLGGGYNKTNKSSTDCCRSFQGGANDTVTLPGTSETKMLVTTASVGVTPFFKYHIDTKSNADVYIGVSAPVSLTTTSKTESIITDLANNYERKTTTTNTGPLKINAGGGLIIGCRYFVYCGLALGIETNLGVTSTMQNGNNTTRISIANSGTNNNGAATVEDMGTQPVKTQDIAFGALHNVGVTLTWYLGRKPKPTPTNGGSNPPTNSDTKNIVAPRNPATGSNYADPNQTDMQIPKTPTSPNTEVASMTIKGSGETTPAGNPIVKGKTVSGNIKMEKGISNAGVSVVIEQSESGDKASAITDQQGNFSMVLGNDTVHIIYVNKQEYGKVKIVSPRDLQNGLPTGK